MHILAAPDNQVPRCYGATKQTNVMTHSVQCVKGIE